MRYVLLCIHICLNEIELKTLFNIVEAPFKIVKLWCLCCMMMFRWTNKQPGIQEFWHLWGLYQDIYEYDCISPLNKMGWLTIYSNTAVYEEKWVWYFWSLAYFRFFEALYGALEEHFQVFCSFYTLSKTLIACTDMQLRFLKVKTLLNNAFKGECLLKMLVNLHTCNMYMLLMCGHCKGEHFQHKVLKVMQCCLSLK